MNEQEADLAIDEYLLLESGRLLYDWGVKIPIYSPIELSGNNLIKKPKFVFFDGTIFKGELGFYE